MGGNSSKDGKGKKGPRLHKKSEEKLDNFDNYLRTTLEGKNVIKENENTMFLRANGRKYKGLTQEKEGTWKGEFKFIWMGDPQIGFGDESKEIENTQKTVEFINKSFNENHSIKFVIVCGDHTHNFEDVWSKKETLEVNQQKRRQQLDDYKKIWRRLDKNIPLVCVCGNHDVGNSPTEKTIKLYTDEFGDDYFVFWAGGVKFIALNSQLVQHPEESGTLAKEHEDWFEKSVKEDNCRKIVFAHIPPFCWHVEENDTNFNWPQEVRKKWLDRMIDAGVKNMYCAHYHRRAEGTYKDFKVMVTAAVGTSIFTKECPDDVKDELEQANFKISREGFGGLGAEPETSGLYVVTIGENGPSEKWMSISDICEDMDVEKKSTTL